MIEKIEKKGDAVFAVCECGETFEINKARKYNICPACDIAYDTDGQEVLLPDDFDEGDME